MNDKIDAVSWADPNFSAIPSIKFFSVNSNSTGLKIPWAKFEFPVTSDNGFNWGMGQGLILHIQTTGEAYF